MINNERLEIVLDQIQDLHTLVEGLKECGDAVPAFLTRMCDEKLEKIGKNLHLLVKELPEPMLVPILSKEEPVQVPIVDLNPVEPLPDEVPELSIPVQDSLQNDIEYVVEADEEKTVDDFDRFVQNLVQPSIEIESQVQETKPSDRTIIGEKFAAQVLHEKIAVHSNERVVEQVIGKQLKADLNKAISLNDKFRFQRELFHGNGAKMADTLNRLNGFSSLEESLAYIRKHHTWDDTNETVKYFYSILEKRFNS